MGENKLKSSQTQKIVIVRSQRLLIRLCWTLPHAHLSDRWWKQLVWAVDLNASKSADDLLKFQSVLKQCGWFNVL